MSHLTPRIMIAGEREEGGLCAHCGMMLQLGQPAAVCRDCGELHHETCWQLKPRCGSYECLPPTSLGDGRSDGARQSLKISHDDLSSAEPLPTRSAADHEGRRETAPRRRWNRASVWAFGLSLLGIPLFGLVTGLVAIVIACIALAGHSPGRRGAGLGVAAILIGLGEVIGWAIGLSFYLGSPQVMVALDDMVIDIESLGELPDYLVGPMRANVVVQSASGLGQGGLGSGVVLAIRDGSAFIVTNRHVVDPNYSDATTTVPKDLGSLSKITISTLGHSSLPGIVEWVAPGGVDLAVVTAPLLGDDVRAARWDRGVAPIIGDKVFAIGNPHGLGWTHSAGDISQLRKQTHGGYKVRILQTTAAINPGNSGGGLYDATGRLIGINTLTGDKRVAEGLGFSISLPTLLDLLPERFQFPDRSPEANPE